jgi:hypothetical protein
MREMEGIQIIPFKKVLKKRLELRMKSFSLPAERKIKIPSKIKNRQDIQGEFPFDKWIMPPRLQCYLKYNDYDFL